MKTLLIIAGLFMGYGAASQCPFAVTLNSPGNCVGDPLSVNTGSTLSQIVWQLNGSMILTVKATSTGRTGITVAGGLSDRGSLAGQLNNPIGLYVDGIGNVYITDRLNYRIQKWAPGASSGTTVAGGNGQGVGANQLSDPIGVFVDPTGNVYVDDYGNNRIQEWGPAATSGTTVAGGNGQGSAPNQLAFPTGVFVDDKGDVFIADAGNDRVQEWTPGATSGVTVAGGNGQGPAPNQLAFPTGVFVDPSGNLYISDEKNNRVQEWAPGATTGTTAAGGNGGGSAANQLNTPYSVYVDASGNLFVDDQVNARIQEWAPGATNGTTVAGGNGGGSAANQLSEPTGVFLDAKGVIYIADYDNNRIQKWTSLSAISNTYTANAAGSYNAVVTDNNGCVVTTSTIIVNPVTPVMIDISATDSNICAGASVTFTAIAVNGGTKPFYQWQINGLNTGLDNPVYTSAKLSNGDLVTCMMTSNAVCPKPALAGSNGIPIKVSPNIPLSVSIAADTTIICSGSTANFMATPSAGSTTPSYRWQIDGTNAPGNVNGPAYSTHSLANADIITCLMTNDASCFTAASNPITMTVIPTPRIDSGLSLSISRGQSVVLQPTITGDIASYSWSPPTGLSSTAVPTPLASPPTSVDYTLQITATDGCKATGKVAVKVSAPIRIPTAFSPNGDGVNDIFYILGGPDGSRIKDFSVFSRSGQKVFQVHNAPPGDPAFGWNGEINGSKAQTGVYAYIASISLSNGSVQVFKGTILLIR
jgi:gliding motility-associated-like protein